jgi:hypothetical protein
MLRPESCQGIQVVVRTPRRCLRNRFTPLRREAGREAARALRVHNDFQSAITMVVHAGSWSG